MIIPPPPPSSSGPRRVKLFNPTWQLNYNTQEFYSTLQELGVSLNDDDLRPAIIPDGMANGESPKLKFNFTVEFAFRDNNPNIRDDIIKHPGHEDPHINKFSVLKVTRPAPTVNYVKANFYNFRTNVATNVDYGTINLVFYDDSSNRAHDIFDKYFQILSPVFNYTTESRANTMDRYGIYGMSSSPSSGTAASPIGFNPDGTPIFPSVNATTEPHTASLGELEARHGIIRYIKIYHEYFVTEPGINNPSRKTTVYTYLNPKIVSVNMDDLDMSQSTVTTVDLTFNYDSVFVIHKDSPPSTYDNVR
jgi:hypothetical protein